MERPRLGEEICVQQGQRPETGRKVLFNRRSTAFWDMGKVNDFAGSFEYGHLIFQLERFQDRAPMRGVACMWNVCVRMCRKLLICKPFIGFWMPSGDAGLRRARKLDSLLHVPTLASLAPQELP